LDKIADSAAFAVNQLGLGKLRICSWRLLSCL